MSIPTQRSVLRSLFPRNSHAWEADDPRNADSEYGLLGHPSSGKSVRTASLGLGFTSRAVSRGFTPDACLFDAIRAEVGHWPVRGDRYLPSGGPQVHVVYHE